MGLSKITNSNLAFNAKFNVSGSDALQKYLHFLPSAKVKTENLMKIDNLLEKLKDTFENAELYPDSDEITIRFIEKQVKNKKLETFVVLDCKDNLFSESTSITSSIDFEFGKLPIHKFIEGFSFQNSIIAYFEGLYGSLKRKALMKNVNTIVDNVTPALVKHIFERNKSA